MDYISIKNWEKYQHYKKRSPPWIKLYKDLLDDYEYGGLQDDSKLLLISLFILASCCDNLIPNDPVWIKNKAMVQFSININPLLEAGFIQLRNGDSKVIAK